MLNRQVLVKKPEAHVGMVSTFRVKCGIAAYTKYLCEALDREKVHAEILAEKPYPENSIDQNFSSSIPYRIDWIRNEPYFDLIQDSKEYDILHIQHQFSLFPDEYTMGQLMYQAKKPIVLTMHDVIPPNPRRENYFKTLFTANKLIVHTKTCFNLLQAWNVDMNNVSLIPMGTLQMHIPNKSITSRELGFQENAEIIMSCGFIHESKGIMELIRTLAEILKTHPKAVLVHAGGTHPSLTSSYLTQILQTATNHAISSKQLRITQWIPDAEVSKWFAISDVIVLNYARDYACASGAAHMAMAAHRPIIKTTDSCLEEIPGYQVPPLSHVDLYKGILTVLEDENLQRDLVKAAEKASQEMSWENCSEET